MKSTDLRPGNAVKMDGKLLVVVSTSHVKPGKGPAFVQAKFRNVVEGGIVEKRLRSGEDVDRVDLDRREMEYLYSDQAGHVFMDHQTFDQHHLNEAILGDAMSFLKANTSVTALAHDGKIISVELPATVDLQVTDTPPVATGATVTNQLKEAKLETGITVRVPQFITNGEVVRIKTADSSYVGRAKD